MSGGLGPGSRAPRARLPRLGGGWIDLPGQGPLTLAAFWKASCPTCRFALPFVEKLHERADGLGVIGVAEDDAATTRRLADELGLRFPIGIESEPWEVSAAYGLSAVPTLFLIDASGRVLASGAGFARADFEEFARRAAEAAGGEPADPFEGSGGVPDFRPG